MLVSAPEQKASRAEKTVQKLSKVPGATFVSASMIMITITYERSLCLYLLLSGLKAKESW